MELVDKDPNAELDYGFDWKPADDPDDQFLDVDVIVASTWVVDPAVANGLVIESESHDDTTTTVWLSGGVVGREYLLVNQIATDNVPARKDERTILVTIVNK